MRERQRAEQHLKEQHAEAPNVNTLIVWQLADDLVRVVTRSTRLASPGSLVLGLGPCARGETEVADAHFEVLALDENVLRLDIAMHDAPGVDALEGVDKLREDLARILLVEVAPRLDLHEVPEVGQRKEGQHDRDVTLLVDDEVLDLAHSWDAEQLIHYGHLVHDILEEVLLADLGHAHVLEAAYLARLLVDA